MTTHLRKALEKIANHPEHHDDGSRSYAVGWAFHNVQQIAKAALAATPPSRPESVGAVREALDNRQKIVIEWGERCFGADHMRDKIVRAARFFEEAAELVQAVGLPRDHAMRAFDHVYSRAAGDPAQEAGGVANTLMALCGAIDLSFDGCQQAEIARCLAKDPAHFAARNEAKLRAVDAALATPSTAAGRDEIARILRNKLSAVVDHDGFAHVQGIGFAADAIFALGATVSPQDGRVKECCPRCRRTVRKIAFADIFSCSDPWHDETDATLPRAERGTKP